jgi:CubicO group peptidase (beta-lactamase class C family)
MHIGTGAGQGLAAPLFAICLLVASGGTAAATEPPIAEPLASIERVMREWVDRRGVGRASLAVMKDDRLVLAVGYNGRAAAERVPIWSLSKAITAMCIAALAGEGRLHLDDPIEKLLPRRFGDFSDPRAGRATIAQLLSHRGGWPREADGNRFSPGMRQAIRAGADVEAIIPAILRTRLDTTPGTAYRYSNLDYLLLGRAIEAISGETYAAACSRRVLEPAGISHAELDARWGKLLDSAAGWSLSGVEYLAFLRLLAERQPDFLTPAFRRFLSDPRGKETGAAAGRAYTLGLNIVATQGGRPLFWHWGSWIWDDADRAGTILGFAENGAAWFASFEGISADDRPDLVRELDASFWAAIRHVTTWPDDDLFPRFEVGPLPLRH